MFWNIKSSEYWLNTTAILDDPSNVVSKNLKNSQILQISSVWAFNADVDEISKKITDLNEGKTDILNKNKTTTCPLVCMK